MSMYGWKSVGKSLSDKKIPLQDGKKRALNFVGGHRCIYMS